VKSTRPPTTNSRPRPLVSTRSLGKSKTSNVSSTGRFKSLGLTIELDEMQRSDARNKLMDLRNERYDLTAKVRDIREHG